MKAILCADENWAIGYKNRQLVSIPSDMRFFRETTSGHVVVMGRKTFDSIGGKVLDNRTNIILTRNLEFKAPGAVVVHGKEELVRELKKYDTDDIYVIGGAAVYRLLLPYCDTVYVTKVDYAYQADTWFTNLDLLPEWELAEESEEQTCFDITFTFRTYRRKYRTTLPE